MVKSKVTIDELRQVIEDSSHISVKEYIERPEYFNWIKSGLNNNFVKVVTGFRRTGKSFLLKQLKQYLMTERSVQEENIMFINFEHDILAKHNTVEDLRDILELFEARVAKLDNEAKIYLFLDEIQNIKYWEKFVRTIYDSNKTKYNIYITGSNSSLLSSEFSTALAGRTIEMQVNPFSFVEYLELLGIKIVSGFDKVRNKAILDKHLNTYLHNGGLPETIGKDEQTIRQYVKGLFRKVLLDDIVKRFKVEKVSVIEKLLYYIFSNIGGTTSFKNIVGVLKNEGESVTVPTLQEYALMYEQAFALSKIAKFDWKTKQIFSKQYKFYAVDNGLANNINASKIDIDEKLLENLVYNVLAHKYEKVYYGRDEYGKEIDFIVIQEDGKYLKIQVTLELHEQNKKRELGNFALVDKYLEKGDNILITLRGKNQTREYGGVEIKEVTLLDFLLGV